MADNTEMKSYIKNIIQYIYDNEDAFADEFKIKGFWMLSKVSCSDDKLYVTYLEWSGCHINTDFSLNKVLEWVK